MKKWQAACNLAKSGKICTSCKILDRNEQTSLNMAFEHFFIPSGYTTGRYLRRPRQLRKLDPPAARLWPDPDFHYAVQEAA